MRHVLTSASTPPAPRLPEGVRVYAVGDIHGRADLLARLLSQIDAHLAQNPVLRPIEVFLGDYVDRGPDSRRVIDLLIKRRGAHETIFLKGNHETYLLEFLRDPKILDIWRQHGGFETLLSYDMSTHLRSKPAERKELARSFASILPDDHLRFLSQLTTNFTCGDFLFVHAGVRPGIPLDRQREEDLLGIRQDFLQSDDDFGKYIVHGHSPVREPDIRSNRINIDTGAFATDRLTCLMIEGEEMQFIAQESDDAHAVSDDLLTTRRIDQDAFLPKAELPEFVENSPAIVHAGTEEWNQPTSNPSSAAASIDPVVAAGPEPAQSTGREPREGISLLARLRVAGHKKQHIAIPLVIGASVVGAISTQIPRSLTTPLPEINTNTNDHRILSGTGAHERPAGLAQTGESGGRVLSERSLVLQQNVTAIDGEAIPLGVQVSGDAVGLALELGGLPTGMTISSGRSVGTGVWRILATDIADAKIYPPVGFAGSVDLAVELRSGDDTVIDRRSLHLEWSSKPAVAAAPNVPAGADYETVITHNADRLAAASQLDQQQIDFLVERSQRLISEGDVEAARILLERAAEARDARAALALGATYDPIMLAILHVRGITADVPRAREWYEKANEFGSQEAQQRLNLLATATP
jgi:serine/threonine protein phosphatase 1